MGEFLANNIPDFFWGLAAFVIFVLIVLKFGLKPVMTAVDERERRIASQLDQAEATNKKAAELQAKLDEQLSGAEAKIAAMIRDAESDAEDHKARILADGRAEAERLRVRALREIEAARHEAILALRQEVAEVSTIVAEKILQRELDAAANQELVGSAVASYERKLGHDDGGAGA